MGMSPAAVCFCPQVLRQPAPLSGWQGGEFGGGCLLVAPKSDVLLIEDAAQCAVVVILCVVGYYVMVVYCLVYICGAEGAVCVCACTRGRTCLF